MDLEAERYQYEVDKGRMLFTRAFTSPLGCALCNTIDNALTVEIDGFLTENALARVKGCRVGDRVHSVNGQEMHHVRFNKVVAILKETPFPIEVLMMGSGWGYDKLAS
jgi:hypothetical protein